MHLREVAGTVYVCLADTPPDFAAYAEAIGRQLAPHGLANAKVAAEVDLVEHGNWKLVMENSRECYHCATGHRELMRSLLDIYDFSDPAAMAPISAYWADWDRAGLPSGVEDGPDFRAARLPFVNAARSITVDGGLAVRKPLGIGPPDSFGSLRWVHYPTTFNHALGDFAVLIRMLPLGPQETLVTTKFLVARDAVEGVDYDVGRLTHVWNVTNAEDKAFVERNQAGINSIGYAPGPYSPALEAGVIKFVDWYLRRDAGVARGRASARGAAPRAGRMIAEIGAEVVSPALRTPPSRRARFRARGRSPRSDRPASPPRPRCCGHRDADTRPRTRRPPA